MTLSWTSWRFPSELLENRQSSWPTEVDEHQDCLHIQESLHMSFSVVFEAEYSHLAYAWSPLVDSYYTKAVFLAPLLGLAPSKTKTRSGLYSPGLFPEGKIKRRPQLKYSLITLAHRKTANISQLSNPATRPNCTSTAMSVNVMLEQQTSPDDCVPHSQTYNSRNDVRTPVRRTSSSDALDPSDQRSSTINCICIVMDRSTFKGIDFFVFFLAQRSCRPIEPYRNEFFGNRKKLSCRSLWYVEQCRTEHFRPRLADMTFLFVDRNVSQSRWNVQTNS